MTTTRFEIETFDGKGDFGSWKKKKMRVLLSHHKVLIALELDDRKWSNEQIAKTNEIRKEAFNLIFPHLGDTMIRQVDGMTKPLDLWNRLESLYVIVSAPNVVYLKGMLFNFRMNASKSIDKNIDEFTKLTLLLRGIDQALGDTSETMILLNVLPDDYNVVKHALQYIGIVPTLELVISGIKARELELHTSKRSGNNLFVKGKFEKRHNGFNTDQNGGSRPKGKQNENKGKQKQAKWKCYHCGKEGHIKKYCYDFIKKQKQGGNVTVAASNSNALVEVLNVSCSSTTNE